jgi:hypothetical protein
VDVEKQRKEEVLFGLWLQQACLHWVDVSRANSEYNGDRIFTVKEISIFESFPAPIALEVVVSEVPLLVNIGTSTHRALTISYIPHAFPPNRTRHIQSLDLSQ